MEWLALLMPIVLSLLALLLFRKRLTWWETVLPIMVSIVVIMIMKWSMVKSLVTDTEYYSAYAKNAMHYDEWDEYVHKTCYRTISCGKNCTTTIPYDCSYVDNHPEYWEVNLSSGESIGISKQKYLYLKQLWNNEEFVEMNRDYHNIDGDAQKTNWNNKFQTINSFDSCGSYDNKPQTAETVFHFEKLDSIKQKMVFDYPEINGTKQNSCINCDEYSKIILRKINALHGSKCQIKIFVIIFNNKQESVAELQKQYWKGGNKNELVICVDSKSRWAKSFSWSDDKLLEAKANQIFMNEKTTIQQKLILLNKIIPELWKRKEFKDFDYIDIQLTTTQLGWIYIITFNLSIIALCWGIFNNISQKDN